MARDPRHLLAGVLTLTMFVMLGDMVKRDYYDAHPQIHKSNKASDLGIESVADRADDLWKKDGLSLKPCWEKPVLADGADESKGYVTFSLTNGPEYHVSQIADAVVVARFLRAKLVIPEIRGNKPGDKRSFEDVYDAEKFVASLEGVVEVVKSQPAEALSRDHLAVAKIPNRITEEYIAENLEDPFRAKGNIRLVTYFPTVNMKKNQDRSSADSVACLGMFGTLVPQFEVQEVVDSMLDRLRSLSNGHFVAVDLRIDVLGKKSCHRSDSGTKSCYDPREIALFLQKIGFGRNTTVYVTQTKWDSSLNALKDLFPNTYTKESMMPPGKKGKFLSSDSSEFEKVIDFYICSQSEVFVPALSGLFYANVAGMRIASGKTQILVPGDVPTSSAAPEAFLSHYVLKRNHLAYSCFC